MAKKKVDDPFDIDTAPEPQIPWTHFWDMHSGGGTKIEPWEHIYIQAPEAEARVIFYNRFHRSPDRVTCTCCGGDYSVSEGETLERITAYHRNLRYAERVRSKGIPAAPGDYRYLEPNESLPPGWKRDKTNGCGEEHRMPNGTTLRDYIREGNVKVIPEEEILPVERVGTVPEEDEGDDLEDD